MGGFASKEWSEVFSNASPGSPVNLDETPDALADGETIPAGFVARRRVLPVDPRSISDDVTRTPIQVEKSPTEKVEKAEEATEKDDMPETPNRPKPSFLDPRSPSAELPRTPIVLTKPAAAELAVEAEEEVVPQPPMRGASLVAATQEFRNVANEKEEGEITDSDEEEEDETKKIQLKKPLPESPLKVKKSTLETDCRSPLLIENEDSSSTFEQGLAKELAKMSVQKVKKEARKPLGQVDLNKLTNTQQEAMAEKALDLDNAQNDSLVI